MKKMLLNSLLFLGLATTGAANAKTVEDFQTWGNVTATGSLGFINPELKNAKYWLEGFADKIRVSLFVYLSATLIVLIIGLMSISYQTIKAANYNPARALRIE